MFGVGDTLQCLEMGAVETLIVWENLEVTDLSQDHLSSRPLRHLFLGNFWKVRYQDSGGCSLLCHAQDYSCSCRLPLEAVVVKLLCRGPEHCLLLCLRVWLRSCYKSRRAPRRLARDPAPCCLGSLLRLAGLGCRCLG